jgi:hypothetical protein
MTSKAKRKAIPKTATYNTYLPYRGLDGEQDLQVVKSFGGGQRCDVLQL